MCVCVCVCVRALALFICCLQDTTASSIVLLEDEQAEIVNEVASHLGLHRVCDIHCICILGIKYSYNNVRLAGYLLI